MAQILLPVNAESGRSLSLPDSRFYSIIGGNGAGKSRFMDILISNSEEECEIISPVKDSYPFTPFENLGSLTENFETRENRGNREDCGNQENRGNREDFENFAAIQRIWSNIFEGSEMIITPSGLRFTNNSGSDNFEADKLSRGEKTALGFLLSILMADRKAILFIDSPTLFLHPSVSSRLWDEIEAWRNQNTFVYDTVDPVFAASRPGNVTIWIKSYQKDPEAWNYTIVDGEDQRDEFLLNLLGSRRPVLFIEGDSTHSIDYPLYSAIFNEYTIKPVGSCNKVIEATRTFGSLKPMHRLESHGLVDRDRRTDGEVSYLRLKNIMVPEVAEVENIFLSEPVVRIMASLRRQNPDKIFRQVEKEVINFFGKELERQALQHTRHRMKRDVERKIDARFTCITALELHIKGLIKKLHPRETYNMLFREFKTMYNSRDYTGILRVFNDKTLFRQSCVIKLLKFSSPDDYISGVLKAIRSNSAEGLQLKTEIRNLFNPPDFLLSNADTDCASDCKSFIQSGT